MAPGANHASRRVRSGRRPAKVLPLTDADPATTAQVPVSYRLNRDIHLKLRAYCFVHKVSQNQFVADAVQEKLKKAIAAAPIPDGLLDVIGK